MLSKTKKVITTPPPVLCSVASYKLFYSTTQRVETLSLLFVPPAKDGGMEINMQKSKKDAAFDDNISAVNVLSEVDRAVAIAAYENIANTFNENIIKSTIDN